MKLASLFIGGAIAAIGVKAYSGNTTTDKPAGSSTNTIKEFVSKIQTIKSPTSAIMPSLIASQTKRQFKNITPNFSNLGLNNVKSGLGNIGNNISNGVSNLGNGISSNISNPFSNLLNHKTNNNNSNSSSKSNVSNGGLAGKASDYLGLGVFFSGANNIKNFVEAGVTGKSVKTFNTKYGTQTYLVNPKKSGHTASQVASNHSNYKYNVKGFTGPQTIKKTYQKKHRISTNLNSSGLNAFHHLTGGL